MATPEAAAGPVHAASCIKITGDGTSGDGTYKIVPYQMAVDIYVYAYTILHDIYEIDNLDNSAKQPLLQNIHNYFNNAIRALHPTKNAALLTTATQILTDINTLISSPVPAAAAAATAATAATAAPAAAPVLDKNFLLNASDILFNIAQLLAPPTLPQSNPIKGGRRKRNTRHKHRKNKNKTRVGRR